MISASFTHSQFSYACYYIKYRKVYACDINWFSIYCLVLVTVAWMSQVKPLASLCGPWGCKNRACTVLWPEVIKGILNQGVACFVSQGSFFCMFCVSSVCCV